MGRGSEYPGVELHRDKIRIVFQLEGKRQRVSLGIRPTKPNLKYADGLRRDVVAAIKADRFEWNDWFPESGGAPTGSKSTFNELADDYLGSLGHLAESSRRGYEKKLRYWRSQFGETPIRDIRYSSITRAISEISFNSAKTRNDAVSVLRQCLNHAVSDRLLTDNPALRVPWMRRMKPEPDPLTPDEVQAVLTDISEREHDVVHNYFQLAFFTGLRPSEIVALQWGDIDLRGGSIRVDKARVYQTVKPTKTYERRDVELMSQSREALIRQKMHTFLAGGEVFLHPDTGRPLNDEKAMRLVWNRVLRRLGIRHRVAYQTRHTFATMNLMAGANAMWVARMMGHANPTITMNTYGRWIDGQDQSREVSKLEQQLGANLGAKRSVEGDLGGLSN